MARGIGASVDVAKVHERVLADYRAFTSGFGELRDNRVQAFADEQFDKGVQWPDPRVGLIQSFPTSWSVSELDRDGLRPPETGPILRLGRTRKTPAVTPSCSTVTWRRPPAPERPTPGCSERLA